jgi:putative tryptophan/tyrosine transport system substrate-binding protein
MGETMRRREFIALLGASVTWPFAALAQEPGRTYRLGVLFAAPRSDDASTAFLEGARRQGFIEGQNLAVIYHGFAMNPDLLPEWVAELVKARVDVIATVGDLAIRTVQEGTKTIPILAATDDMLGAGLVNSLAHPNGNTTGLSILATELDGKRQELLIEAVPALRRMAVLADSNRTAAGKLDALLQVANAANVQLVIHPVASGEEIVAALDMAQASGATALNVLASPMLYANRQLIMDRAAALRMAAMYQWPETAEEGGFAAYGPRLMDLFRDLFPRMLAQLLRGTKVADIPVEQPTKFELVINLKTAKAMGVTVPEALLVRADKVIE